MDEFQSSKLQPGPPSDSRGTQTFIQIGAGLLAVAVGLAVWAAYLASASTVDISKIFTGGSVSDGSRLFALALASTSNILIPIGTALVVLAAFFELLFRFRRSDAGRSNP